MKSRGNTRGPRMAKAESELDLESPFLPGAFPVERPVLTKKEIKRDADAMANFVDPSVPAALKDLQKTSKPISKQGPIPRTLWHHTTEHYPFSDLLLGGIIPPYDNDFYTGSGKPGSKIDGHAEVMISGASTHVGDSASGFGINISSPIMAWATVEFLGTYSFLWTTTKGTPEKTAVTGALSYSVYRDGATLLPPRPVSYLFMEKDFKPNTSGSGSGLLSKVRIGGYHIHSNWLWMPVKLLLAANVTYGIWLSCGLWEIGVKGTDLFAFVQCDVPVIRVTTTPALVIPFADR